MYSASVRPRPGWTRVEIVVVVLVLITSMALLLPACQRHIGSSPRTQGINNLKNIGLAIHGFHDANKFLPFNGTTEAASGDSGSGSWAFQILPYVDQQPMYTPPGTKAGDPIPAQTRLLGVHCYVCPHRGRPMIEEGHGAWTDYFLNNYLNDPKNANVPNRPNSRLTMNGITDGTSNTVLAGQGNIATGSYAEKNNVIGSTNIFTGGTLGTMRAGPSWVPGIAPIVSLQRDSTEAPNLAEGGWGGPYPQGALILMGDATVRLFPYAMKDFGAFLTPTGGENVELPDT